MTIDLPPIVWIVIIAALGLLAAVVVAGVGEVE